MSDLSSEARAALPATAFAVPSKRELPVHDAIHARLAASQVGRTQGLTPAERATAQRRIQSALRRFGHSKDDTKAILEGTSAGYASKDEDMDAAPDDAMDADADDAMCAGCKAGMPEHCSCDACMAGDMADCKCDMSVIPTMHKDFDSSMGIHPFNLEGQKPYKSAADPGITADPTILYYHTLAKFDKSSCLVTGIVSDETLDLDNQIADKGWLDQALPEWFRDHGNMREMHQPIAAGKAKKLTDTGTGYELVSKVVNPQTIQLFDEDILRAYSIGIKDPVLKQDVIAKNGRIIGGTIIEVSYVDYPANPSCRVVVAKAAGSGLEAVSSQIDISNVPDALGKAAEPAWGDGSFLFERYPDFAAAYNLQTGTIQKAAYSYLPDGAIRLGDPYTPEGDEHTEVQSRLQPIIAGMSRHLRKAQSMASVEDTKVEVTLNKAGNGMPATSGIGLDQAVSQGAGTSPGPALDPTNTTANLPSATGADVTNLRSIEQMLTDALAAIKAQQAAAVDGDNDDKLGHGHTPADGMTPDGVDMGALAAPPQTWAGADAFAALKGAVGLVVKELLFTPADTANKAVGASSESPFQMLVKSAVAAEVGPLRDQVKQMSLQVVPHKGTTSEKAFGASGDGAINTTSFAELVKSVNALPEAGQMSAYEAWLKANKPR